MVNYYYPTDNNVQRDTELQEWISEIFTHGFLGNKASGRDQLPKSLRSSRLSTRTVNLVIPQQQKKKKGIPTSFLTVEDVTKFLTMVIFTVSAQHSALNNGQVGGIPEKQ